MEEKTVTKYHVTHSTGCWIEAESEESAQRQLAELIRENIEWTHIEITGEDDEKSKQDQTKQKENDNEDAS